MVVQGSGALGARLVVVPRPLDRLLTVRAVADQLGVSTATVYTLVERGELGHVRVSNAIRIAGADVSAFITARKHSASRGR
jgi:excisionase family DNA binding protein